MKRNRLTNVEDYINKVGIASFSELCEAFGVSPATMRRDLSELEKRGMIKRLHGAAQSLLGLQKSEPPYSDKIELNTEEKRRIAQTAYAMIHEGDIVVLDSSTTVLELAVLLAESDLNITVITNDMKIAYILAPHQTIELIAVGGYIRRGYYTSVGMFAENLWVQLHADKLFLGVDSVNINLGMMNYRIEELSSKRLMLECAKQCIVLCDHTKFNASAVLQICPLSRVSSLITGTELDENTLDKYQEAGLDIITA